MTAVSPGGVSLSYGIYQQPKFGTVTVDSLTGDFIYVPTGSYSGSVDFLFYVANGSSASNLATVTIDLTNAAPLGEDAIHNFHWQGSELFNLVGADSDNDIMNFEIVKAPGVGVLTLLNEATGEVVFANNSSSATGVYFTYRVNDGADNSSVYRVDIRFTNTVPVAPPLVFESFVDIPVATQIEGVDEDTDSLMYELLNTVSTGEISLSKNGLLNYTGTELASHSVTVTYRVFDGRDWSDPSEITLLIHGGSVVDYSPIYFTGFSAGQYAGLAGLEVNFSSALSGGSGNYIYQWVFGDGTLSNEKSPKHKYLAVGEYDVSLIVMDENDPANRAVGYFQVLVLEEAKNFSPVILDMFKASEYAGTSAHQVIFTASASGASGSYDYLWDFGDGSSSVKQNPTYVFKSPGTYNVRLSVMDKSNRTNVAVGMLKIIVLSESSESSAEVIKRTILEEGEEESAGHVSVALSLILLLLSLYRRKIRH